MRVRRGGWGVIVLAMTGLPVTAQTLDTPRSMSIGAYAPLVSDTRSFTANPAGLTAMRDWDFHTATTIALPEENPGFVFQGFGFGKKLFGNAALALEYTPGTSARFVTPTTISIGGGNTPQSNDRAITYEEPFALGIAWQPRPELSFGAGLRYRTEKVQDTQYEIVLRDTISIPTSSVTTSTASSWPVDAGALWTPLPTLSLSLTARNLFFAGATKLPAQVSELRLPRRAIVELGAAYRPVGGVSLAASAATDGYGAVGGELGLPLRFTLRGSVILDRHTRPFVAAVGAGLGWSFQFVDMDAAYLRFTNQRGRTGSASAGDFDAQELTRIDLHSFSEDRIALSIRAMFGRVRSSLARIEGVEMLGGIYPSAAEALAFKPVGKARVKNVSDRPIQARVSFFVERIMDAPTETEEVLIAPGASADVPFSAVFNERVRSILSLQVRDGEVSVIATPAEEYDDRTQTRVLVYGRNDWDGNVTSLRYFVTPNDPAVLRYSRDILLGARDTLSRIPRELEPVVSARILFDAFAGKLVFVNDPKQSADFVQYPSETLSLRGGDCDDMTVCFASLLSSIGISTAFVDVIPPGRPDRSHLFLLFDTGLPPSLGAALTTNPKRYVVRKNRAGTETLWIPVESTVIQQGFDAAWSEGAQQYFDDVEVGLGLIRGWVRIVDVN